MTDNLEQLEKDWPQKHPKNLTPRGFVKFYLIFAALFALMAGTHAIFLMPRAKSQHDDLWLFAGVVRLFWIAFPLLWAATAFPKIKKAVDRSGASQELLFTIEFYGAQTVFFVGLAIFTVIMLQHL